MKPEHWNLTCLIIGIALGVYGGFKGEVIIGMLGFLLFLFFGFILMKYKLKKHSQKTSKQSGEKQR